MALRHGDSRWANAYFVTINHQRDAPRRKAVASHSVSGSICSVERDASRELWYQFRLLTESRLATVLYY